MAENSSNSRNIPVENVHTFIEALKKESITTFNYPIWKEKFKSVLEGIDAQIFSVADERRDKKNAIVTRVQELREQGMNESSPGFDVALQLLEIMPGYEKELHLRGVEIEVAMTMFMVSANIIETMRGLGISENIVKEQQKFLSDEWERMQGVFNNYIGEVMKNHKEQTTVQIANANELSKKLLEHIDHRDGLIKEIMTKGVVTKEDIKDMMSKNTENTVKHVYEQPPQHYQQQQPYQQQPRFNQQSEHNIQQTQQHHEQSDERSSQKPVSVTSEKEIEQQKQQEQTQRMGVTPRPVTASEILDIQNKIEDDKDKTQTNDMTQNNDIPSNITKKKPQSDIHLNDVFNNVDTHSKMHDSKSQEDDEKKSGQDDVRTNTSKETKPTKSDEINTFIENAKQAMGNKTNAKQVKEGRRYYRWNFKKKFNRKTVTDELEKVFDDRLNELEQTDS